VVGLPGVVTPLGDDCSSVRDTTRTGSWTDSFANIQCYDTLKVQATINQIDGKTHSGGASAPVPDIFGMNFQVVSVGQKLIEHSSGNPTITGGYKGAIGTPTDALLGEIKFADTSIGLFV